jgi:dUTP pyrophosphatase
MGQTELTVKVVRLDEDLPLPTYARDGDAGLDLLARCAVRLGAGEWSVVPTGIAIELPPGFAGFVLPRSGLAAKHGVTCLNTPGLIDSGYRDELRVVLINHATSPYDVARGDRIAQLVVQPVPRVVWAAEDALAPSQRGTGGFGHSGY